MKMGSRIEAERKRLSLTQPALAGRCGVSSEAWRLYERGARKPGALVLAAMSTAGLDVLYILNGSRTPSETGVVESNIHAERNASDSVSDRLREERVRLGMTQAALAVNARVSRKTQCRYETGQQSPKASYLNAIARFGVDIQYVLTGARSFIPHRPRTAGTPAGHA